MVQSAFFHNPDLPARMGCPALHFFALYLASGRATSGHNQLPGIFLLWVYIVQFLGLLGGCLSPVVGYFFARVRRQCGRVALARRYRLGISSRLAKNFRHSLIVRAVTLSPPARRVGSQELHLTAKSEGHQPARPKGGLKGRKCRGRGGQSTRQKMRMYPTQKKKKKKPAFGRQIFFCSYASRMSATEQKKI